MKELSIFIDESGDFGEYSSHSPYYIITMVFHNQQLSIDEDVRQLDEALSLMGIEGHCVHVGPLIRREEDYRHMDMKERQRILNRMLSFIRKADIRYKSFYIEKKHIEDKVEATGKLAQSIGSFIRDNYEEFMSYGVVKIYYDNGQVEVNKILSSVFNALLNNVEFRKVLPSEYKLFQVADLCCTFELIRLKLENAELSNSEKKFFGPKANLKKSYLKPLDKKVFNSKR